MQFDMDSSIGFLLNRTAFASKTEFATKLKSFDLSPEQWSVLFRISQSEGISLKEVALSTYKDQGNLTRMSDKLIKKGLITKEFAKHDRREVKLYATTKAQELIKQIIPLTQEHNKKLMQVLTDQEKEAIVTILNKIYDSLTQGEKHDR